MSQENRLEKTNRVNLLFDFYELLLTEKQQTFLKYYFHDDFSLGEIASEFDISRQAVYEHIKRAEVMLELYEEKLGLLEKQQRRSEIIDQMGRLIHESDLTLSRQQEEGISLMLDELKELY